MFQVQLAGDFGLPVFAAIGLAALDAAADHLLLGFILRLNDVLAHARLNGNGVYFIATCEANFMTIACSPGFRRVRLPSLPSLAETQRSSRFRRHRRTHCRRRSQHGNEVRSLRRVSRTESLRVVVETLIRRL